MKTHSIFAFRLVTFVSIALLLLACGVQESSIAQPTPPTTEPARATPVPPIPTSAPTATPTPAPAAPQALFLAADGQIIAWDSATQSTQVVTKLPAGFDPYSMALAPNGQALAYFLNGKVLIRDLASGSDANVTPAGITDGLFHDFAWAPDSTNVVFSLDTSADPYGSPQPIIYMSRRDDKPASVLAPGFGAKWSPVNNWIAYAGPQYEIDVLYGGGPGGMPSIINAGEASGRSVTGADVFFPQWQRVHWSADGAYIAAGLEIYEAATGKLVMHVPEVEGQVKATILFLSADGSSYGLWRNIRTHPPADPLDFTAHDEIVLVGADGATRVIAKSPEDQCPCLPLATKLSVFWSDDGSAILVIGLVADSNDSGVRLYDGNGKLIWASPLQIKYPIGHAIWLPGGHDVLLNVGDIGGYIVQTNQVMVSLGGGELQPIGEGIALGWRER